MSKKSKFSKKEVALLNKVRKTIKNGDLYHALHYVGDDPIKSAIESTLRDALDKKTFNLVTSIFKIYTDDDLLMELDDEESDT